MNRGNGEDVTLDVDRNVNPNVKLDVRGTAQRGGAE